jgi:pteridine reductase
MIILDKSAVITGATGALGYELALILAQAGCNCICHYHSNDKKAEQLVGDIKSIPRKAVAVKADLTCSEQIDVLFQKAERFGPPRILINSASLFTRTPLEETTFDQARRILDLNLTACIMTAKAFAAAIPNSSTNTDAPSAKIINISDVAAIKPWSQYSLYCASKAGLTAATKALAKELAPDILVNALSPGIADLPENTEDSFIKRQLSFIPMNRFAEIKEITAGLLFLLENDYITGQTLNIDGGRTI